MNFVCQYFPNMLKNQQVQKEILRRFAEPICEMDTKLVVNVLFRNDICSLEQLYKTPMEDIKKFKNIGEVRLEYIKRMKHEISKTIASYKKQIII